MESRSGVIKENIHGDQEWSKEGKKRRRAVLYRSGVKSRSKVRKEKKKLELVE